MGSKGCPGACITPELSLYQFSLEAPEDLQRHADSLRGDGTRSRYGVFTKGKLGRVHRRGKFGLTIMVF